MTTFKVGEIAKHVCDLDNTPEIELRAYDGLDCMIDEPFGLYLAHTEDGRDDFFFGYVVAFSDGMKILVSPQELRKKRPPESDDSAARQAMLDCIQRAKTPARVPA